MKIIPFINVSCKIFLLGNFTIVDKYFFQYLTCTRMQAMVSLQQKHHRQQLIVHFVALLKNHKGTQ